MSIRALHRLAAGYLLVALACSVYVVAEREAEWSELPEFLVLTGALEGLSSGSWLDPLQPEHPYIWLGVGVGFLIGAAALLLTTRVAARAASTDAGRPRSRSVSVRQLAVVLAVLVPASFGCFAYAYLEREVRWSHLPDIEGAYFNRSAGQDAQAVIFGGWFEPFQPEHPYVWLGLGAGLLLAVAILAVGIRVLRHRSLDRPI